MVGALLAVISVSLVGQAIYSIFLSLYSWQHPERLKASSGPEVQVEPKTSFSILVPARDEAKVIFSTLASIVAANYPEDLLQIIVVCPENDDGTIAEVHRAAREY